VFGFPVSEASGQGASLGPRDPAKLPPTDTSRVAVGMEAPDFRLEALNGPPVTLSQFRGKQNVILVFYRGHW
jgi:cytochrome oxidase Cu insertion factor (SCO1/SenC/PrrC family)